MEVALHGSTYWQLDEVAGIGPRSGWFARLGVAAWDHPLYVMLGQLFKNLPIEGLAWRINFISALFASLTIALSYLTSLRIGASVTGAALAAIGLAVSHTFWFHAVTAEVYTLHSFLMLTFLVIVLAKTPRSTAARLIAAAFIAGLGLSNHVMFVLVLIPSIVYCGINYDIWLPRNARDRKIIALAIACFILGFAPWWIQFVRMAGILGVKETAQLAVGLPWIADRWVIGPPLHLLRNLGSYLSWLLYQFLPLGLWFGVLGVQTLRQETRGIFLLLITIFATSALFSMNYNVPDRFTFHFTSFVIFSLFMARGISQLLLYLQEKVQPGQLQFVARRLLLFALMLAPIGIYRIVPITLTHFGYTDSSLGIGLIGTGHRNGIRFFLDPNHRGDTSAEAFARSTLEELSPHALVITPKPTDQETFIVLKYLQLVEKKRSDVDVDLLITSDEDDIKRAVLKRVLDEAGRRPIYLASLSPRSIPQEELSRGFEIAPQANIFRLRPRYGPLQASANAASDRGDNERKLSLPELLRRMERW